TAGTVRGSPVSPVAPVPTYSRQAPYRHCRGTGLRCLSEKLMSLPNPLFTILLFCTTAAWAQPPQQWLLAADRVFDGETLHEQHALLIDGDTIVALAPRSEFALD